MCVDSIISSDALRVQSCSKGISFVGAQIAFPSEECVLHISGVESGREAGRVRKSPART